MTFVCPSVEVVEYLADALCEFYLEELIAKCIIVGFNVFKDEVDFRAISEVVIGQRTIAQQYKNGRLKYINLRVFGGNVYLGGMMLRDRRYVSLPGTIAIALCDPDCADKLADCCRQLLE